MNSIRRLIPIIFFFFSELQLLCDEYHLLWRRQYERLKKRWIPKSGASAKTIKIFIYLQVWRDHVGGYVYLGLADKSA
jgi:hypothetical protein